MHISIVICTYNRSQMLKELLLSLEKIVSPQFAEWEVLVVDNASRDSTAQVVGEFIKNTTLPLRYVHESNQGLSQARNRGIKESLGDIIAFIDDDVVVPDDWLVQALQAFTRHDVDVIGGKVIMRFEEALPAWLDHELQHCLGAFDRGDEEIVFSDENDGMVGIGANICFRRRIFNTVGTFDTTKGRNGKKLLMGEETELIGRVFRNGGKCVYYPKLYLYHSAGKEKVSKSYVLQWHYRFGQWEAQCNKEAKITTVQSMRLMCWSLKQIAIESLRFLKYLADAKYSMLFRTRVNIYRYCGFFSQIMTA